MQITVEVPKGVDPEKVVQILDKYERQKIRGQKHEKAKRKATRWLIEAHEEEYDRLYAKAEKAVK